MGMGFDSSVAANDSNYSTIRSNVDGNQANVNFESVSQLVDKFLQEDANYLQLHDLLKASLGTST